LQKINKNKKEINLFFLKKYFLWKKNFETFEHFDWFCFVKQNGCQYKMVRHFAFLCDCCLFDATQFPDV